MFTEASRAALLDELIRSARADEHVVAAALVGSMAGGTDDRWSDIDLALRLRPGLLPEDAATAWTDRVRRLAEVADVLDVRAGPALYRVLLLRDSLQVDLSFWPHDAFRSTGGPFRLLSGTALEAEPDAPTDAGELVGWGWLHALHARAAIARGRRWQALQMVDGLRDQVIALACARHGLPAHQGRGVDLLPEREQALLLPTVPSSLDAAALAGALASALERLEDEARQVDRALADRIAPPLRFLSQQGPTR